MHATPTTSNSITTKLSTRLAAAALACAFVVAAPGVASAASAGGTSTDDTTTSTGFGDLRPRLERACLRIPNLTLRTDNLLERLNGDAGTRGSIAWLEVQIDRAKDAERDQLVVVLENRLKVRTATIDVLEVRSDRLAKAAAKCAELGVGQ